MRHSIDKTLAIGHGSVSDHEVLTLRAFGRRLGLGVRALCDCQQKGLRTVTVGRMKFVVGSQAVAWFAAQADEQQASGASQ
jgi:hypothetical protein